MNTITEVWEAYRAGNDPFKHIGEITKVGDIRLYEDAVYKITEIENKDYGDVYTGRKLGKRGFVKGHYTMIDYGRDLNYAWRYTERSSKY